MERDHRQDFLLNQVNWLHGAILTPELRGHSRVASYVVTKGKTKYFLKQYSGDQTKRLLKIEGTYCDLGVPTAKIQHLEYLLALDATCCAYEYISGPNLAEAITQFSPSEVIRLGRQIGSALNQFSNQTGKIDLPGRLARLWQSFESEIQRYSDSTARQKILPIDLVRLKASFARLTDIVVSLNPTFAHTDLNLSNVILHEGQPIIVDTSESQLDFRTSNFRGFCWWVWDEKTPQNYQIIYREIIDACFNAKVPSTIHDELAFAVLYEFLIRVQKYAGDEE